MRKTTPVAEPGRKGSMSLRWTALGLSVALLVGVPAAAAPAEGWAVHLQTNDEAPLCSSAAIRLELVGPDGGHASHLEVRLDEPSTGWRAPVANPGDYRMRASVTDCAGIERVTDGIDVRVTDPAEARWITLVAFRSEHDFVLSHVGSCRDRSAESLLRVSGDPQPVVENVSGETIVRCESPWGRGVRVERLVDGAWGEHGHREGYVWPDEVTSLAPGDSFTPERRGIAILVRRNGEPLPDDGRRLLIRLGPPTGSNLDVATAPEYGAIDANCCDVAYVDWPQDPGTPEEP